VTATTTRVRVTSCECCGREGKAGLVPVNVRDRKTGEPVTLRLCADCAAGRDRSWRLRYAVRA